MAEYNFNFTFRGWKAVAALGLVLAFFVGSYLWRFQTIDDTARDSITAWLLRDYQGNGQRDVMQRLQEYKQGLPVQPLPEIKPMNIEFSSISGLRTGKYTNSRMIVKATITVDGGPPPDGMSTRYFYMMNYGDSWRVSRESNSYAYYTALLP